jgi:DNA-binding transcriptional ArsR family regulator
MKNPSVGELEAANMLGALGSPVRLRVYKALLRAGAQGMNVSELQLELGIPASTLVHHLATLVDAGLVGQERRGRELICTARYEEIRRLSAFLMAECCAGSKARRAGTAS